LKWAAPVALVSFLCAGSLRAQDQATPDAAALLFEAPQLNDEAPGTTLSYRFMRRTFDDTRLGPSFEDRIKLHLDAGGGTSRTVRVELFSAERRRGAGPFEDATANPILILFLEHHVEHLSRLLRANPRYLKNAIRAALRHQAEIARTEVSLAGRSAPAWRVRVKPFAEDANKARMGVLEHLTYVFVTAEGVPGRIAEIAVTAPLQDGRTGFEERLVYDPGGD
jgi:hypothetical protein